MTKEQKEKYKPGGEACKKEWMAFLSAHPQHPRDTMKVYRYWIDRCWPQMVRRKFSKRDCH